MMKRKITSVMLAAVMTALVFTACGRSASSSYQGQAKKDTTYSDETEKPKETTTPPAASSKAEAPASSAPSEPVPASSAAPEAPAPEPAPEPQPEPQPEPAPEPQPETQPEPAPEPEKVDNNAIRPDVKEAIDSYEKYIDKYCEFMQRADYGDMVWLAEYAKYMSSLTEMQEKFNAIHDKDLTTAETNYYIEVLNRCNEKMFKVADSM